MNKIQYSTRQRDKIVSYNRARYPVPHVPLHGEPHKSCAKCCRLKPLTEFSTKAGTWDGLASRCVECE